ncbi:hypothetical protein [Kurthia zopfii]|uniref:hypothetical protein n=1 Tax=Kurthia zopfii TaxID=1650 RepID=UPI000F6CA6EE|nr:hypothetical protein [Kurthia zopfii]VEI05047.1 Uncharacterised protein [Kurthia zopfii]
MSNFKLIKTAAALALGASVVTSAVVPTDASAASKYKIKNGKLVIAKTGKVAKGYVTYKSTVYKDGKKLTGLKGKTYYKAGKKATGTYKGAYYYKGAKKVTTGTYKGAYYVKGVKKVTTGLYNGRYYKSGAKATGTYKGAYYVKGTKKVTTGTYNGAYYVKGFKKVTTGLYKEEFYQDGKLSKGYAVYNSILYKDAVHNVGLTVFEGKLYDGVSVNKGTEVFEGKLYKGAVLATGLVEHAGLFYSEGALANGVVDGVEYKDGVVVKYEVTEVKTINASEVEVNFSVDVDAETALKGLNYQIELNGKDKLAIEDVKFKGDSKNTVIVRLEAKSTFSAGDKVVVQVKDEIATAKDVKKKIERFSSEVFTFTASAKPQLKSVHFNGAKGLSFTFDRPVNPKTGLIKVDGKSVNFGDLKVVKEWDHSEIAGNYTYTTTDILDAAQIKAGTHEVVIFDVAETARNNAQVSNTLSASYTITEKDSIPEVVSVVADNANRFNINFSEKVTLNDLKSLVIKQGNHEYEVTKDAVSTSAGSFNPKAHITGFEATPEVDHLTGKPVYSITVVIPEAVSDKKFINPLYAADQKTATLDVSVKAYKDDQKFVGIETTKQVVLAKGTTSPQFIEKTVVFTKNDQKTNGLTVKLNNPSKAVAASLTPEDVIFKNAAGVIIPTTEYKVTLAGNDFTVELNKDSKYEGSTAYTATIKKEKIEYTTDLVKTATYNAENTKNNEISVTVKGEADSNFKYVVEDFAGPGKVVSNVKNIVQLKFAQDMDASALKVENYTLDGKALPTGTKIEFLADKKTVQFTLPEQSVKYTTHYKLAVSTNVKTEKGQSVVNNLRDLDVATANVKLTDNTSAELVSAVYLVGSSNAKSSNQIKVVFNEAVKNLDADDLKVLIAGSTTKAGITNVQLIKADDKAEVGTAAIITLASEVNVVQSAAVSIVKGDNNEITSKDLAGNKIKEGSSVTATISTVDTEATTEAAAAAALATAKTDAIKALDAYKEADYDESEKATLKTAKENAVKAIEAAKNDAELKTATDAAKVALDAIKTTAQKADEAQKAVDAEAAKINKIADLTDGKNVLTQAQALVTAGFTVTIKESKNSAIATTGVITQPGKGTGDVTGDVTFKVEKDGVSKEVTISLTIAQKS